MLHKKSIFIFKATLLYLLISPGILQALTLNVIDQDGNAVEGFRWQLENDTTNVVTPGALVSDSISLSIHNSYSPVSTSGYSNGSTVEISADANTRYCLSVLPYTDYSISGTTVEPGQTLVEVTVNALPLPTAQISVFAFVDHNPINGVFDEHDQGLAGCNVVISDPAGQVMQDAFGNMLGTEYQKNPDGSFVLDTDGNPVIETMGDMVITTLTQEDFDAGNNPYNLRVGEAIIKYLTPGKYGVVVSPPRFDDDGNSMEWTQTSTIEGTQTVDAWVKADEPKLFVEGFGTSFNHVFYGYVKTAPAESNYKGQTYKMLEWNVNPPAAAGSIEGTLRMNHFSRPPMLQGFFAGEPLSEGWVALNDPLVRPGASIEAGGPQEFAGLYVTKCDENGYFRIDNVPAGTYQLVNWDEPLDTLFGFRSVTVGEGENVNLGNVLVFRWFGTLEGSVFVDSDEDGFRDSNEMGLRNQEVLLRFRDGTIYQATATDPMGNYSFEEVFPFFKWLVVEIDFLRHKATGMTSIVDYGGEILADNGWIMPSRNKLNPQPQDEINPNTGNNLSRTETGEVLTQAMHLFLGQTNVIDWGKTNYKANENGGISGIVYYATTRAEDDPRYAAAEEWEPGIPRVQMVLYQDINFDKVIDDLNGDGTVTLADVDNYPFGWADGGTMGPEDIKRNSVAPLDTFHPGDAISIGTTDCWDDDKPTGTIQDLPVIHGETIQPGADSFGTWNQVRPGIFDGGFAFTSYFPGGIASGSTEVDGLAQGGYIVESVAPPGYEHVKEEDKNVDFGDSFTPSTLLLPPINVGQLRQVPQYLSFQCDQTGTPLPGIPAGDLIEAPYAGQMRPLPDLKHVTVIDRQNTGVEFFMFTQVPKAARAVGFVNNDLGAEFNQSSPNYGEKITPSWIPISFKDWTGKEITRIYCDEFGGYNALIPSTYTVNVASATGVSPAMLTLVLNDPIMSDDSVDPFYDPDYAVTPWTFDFWPGKTTYLDTPIIPVAAFTTSVIRFDSEEPNNTPVISAVNGPEPEGGPLICTNRANGRVITITSVGSRQIRNPAYNPVDPASTVLITRNYDFGAVTGTVTVDSNDLTINSWTPNTITATVPAGITTGRLVVTRGDNGASTTVGITLNIIDCSSINVVKVPTDFSTIQAAVDDPNTNAGDLIIVDSGTYNENVIVYKPVQIQGVGNGSVFIDANPNPRDRIDYWHARMDALGARDFVSFLLKDPFSASEAPGFIVIGELVYPGGNLRNPDPLNPKTLNPGNLFTTPGQARIDGFTISGSKAGGAVFAITGSKYLVISNNNITNNQGNYGAVTLGTPDIGFDSENYNISVLYNKVHKNGGVQGAGGIALNEYTNNYLVKDNIIMGNISRFNGGGIAHRGYVPGTNVIQSNKIMFNEIFYGALLARAGDGAGIYVGGDVVGGTGAGSVTITHNLIQGNLNGTGYGGGIRAFAVNGEDVRQSPDDDTNWFELNIFNNIIVNNVTALNGAGISLQDTARVNISHNTIVNNDCTSTASLAFEAGQLNSTPQPAGVVSAVHSDILQDLFDPSLAENYSKPILEKNIIWQNRSWYNDASLNGGAGGLAPNPAGPYWDLSVLGSTISTDPHLDPNRCVLTSQIDPATGYDYGSTNGNIYNAPVFADAYVNSLESAAVIDEGGNFISIRFTPISPGSGDYHLEYGSPGIDIGDGGNFTDIEFLKTDYDNETRPGGISEDAGADEVMPLISADFNVDGTVDILDLAIFMSFWQYKCSGNQPCPANLDDSDNVVNLKDYSIFSLQFSQNN